MNRLHGKHILLGVTGGIAACKSPELVRGLRREGAELRVVMTRAAHSFVTPLTLQALSGHPVRGDLFDPEAEAGMDHIALARWADLLLVAPATADCIARLAAGLADDLLATLALATAAPLVIAPAMNHRMWEAEATRRNVALLAGRGVRIAGPAEGDLACGESGPGRMVEPAELVRFCAGLFGDRPLAGIELLVTAGPTREAIDPVRYVSNRSSGKMGFAVARAAAEAGARTTLVSGPVNLPTPPGVERVDVTSAAEMFDAVAARRCDIFIAAAAVADYRPAAPADQKIKKEGAEEVILRLERNPDILAAVASRPRPPFTVGFAAETERVEENALRKLAGKRLEMVAANRVGAGAPGGFDGDQNALTVFWEGGRADLPLQDKLALARELIALVAQRYKNNQAGQ